MWTGERSWSWWWISLSWGVLRRIVLWICSRLVGWRRLVTWAIGWFPSQPSSWVIWTWRRLERRWAIESIASSSLVVRGRQTLSRPWFGQLWRGHGWSFVGIQDIADGQSIWSGFCAWRRMRLWIWFFGGLLCSAPLFHGGFSSITICLGRARRRPIHRSFL
jgi:hypothetical protein